MKLLFDQSANPDVNLLPYQGIVNYYGTILSVDDADRMYKSLLRDIDWKQDEATIFGKKYLTKRKVAWHGDEPYEYTYSNHTKIALPWTETLTKLKKIAEHICGESFNSCLLNLYHDGSESMAWHSDGEKDLKPQGAIGSMSFGAERKFAFKHKETKEKIEMLLEHGSLMVMKGVTQQYWLHRLPPTTKIKTPRINLTFRMMSV